MPSDERLAVVASAWSVVPVEGGTATTLDAAPGAITLKFASSNPAQATQNRLRPEVSAAVLPAEGLDLFPEEFDSFSISVEKPLPEARLEPSFGAALNP